MEGAGRDFCTMNPQPQPLLIVLVCDSLPWACVRVVVHVCVCVRAHIYAQLYLYSFNCMHVWPLAMPGLIQHVSTSS